MNEVPLQSKGWKNESSLDVVLDAKNRGQFIADAASQLSLSGYREATQPDKGGSFNESLIKLKGESGVELSHELEF
jgi:hypothetical protein